MEEESRLSEIARVDLQKSTSRTATGKILVSILFKNLGLESRRGDGWRSEWRRLETS